MVARYLLELSLPHILVSMNFRFNSIETILKQVSLQFELIINSSTKHRHVLTAKDSYMLWTYIRVLCGWRSNQYQFSRENLVLMAGLWSQITIVISDMRQNCEELTEVQGFFLRTFQSFKQQTNFFERYSNVCSYRKQSK